MANALYDKARQRFLDGDLDWALDTIRCVLVDTAGYAVNLAADEFLSAIPAANRVGAPQTLTGKTSTGGVADANDVTFTAVTGASAEAVVLYKDTGSEATSPLIAYLDTGTGLPVTPGGGDILLIWDNGANRIFRL